MPTCCMRCDARCACPFPVYTKICIMLCPDASGGGEGPEGSSTRQDHSLSWYTKGPRVREDNITLGTSLSPQQTFLVLPTTSQACPPEVAEVSQPALS